MAAIARTPLSMASTRSPPESLDLSDLPALIQPPVPTNTLLITNLDDPSIFHPQSLQTIRDILSEHSSEPLLVFAPLKSFRRIVVAFHTVPGAVAIRQRLDGESIMGCRIRVYFGEPTPLEQTDQHLQAPQSQKLFLISPPPSPPAGWVMRNEDPPNKDVHAEDLASALLKLTARRAPVDDCARDAGMEDMMEEARRSTESLSLGDGGRERRGSTTVLYHPQDYGHSHHLPAISVEDLTVSPGDSSPMEDVQKAFHRTSRPPTELMDL